jgi:sialate O-acetylesterase
MAAQLRDAQTSTLSLENTGMAVIMDVGNPADIHPANKKDVGERLALWALAKDYGVGAEYSGPMYESMTIEGNKVSVSFSHADGLQFKGEPGFVEVAGTDGNFVEAKAEISEGKLVASSAKVTSPTAIRYGWCEACEPNLFNGAGLPAVPFNSKTK